MLAALARFSVRRRRIMVFGIWIPLLIAIGFASSLTGSDFATEFEIPASESNDVQTLLEANNPNRAGFSGEIVFASPTGVTTDQVKASMTELFSKVDALEGVTVTSPFDTPGQINQAGTTAFASLDVTIRSQSDLISLGEEIRELGEPFANGDLRIEYGGNIFAAVCQWRLTH